MFTSLLALWRSKKFSEAGSVPLSPRSPGKVQATEDSGRRAWTPEPSPSQSDFEELQPPPPPPHLSILTAKVEPVPTARAVLRLLCQCPAVTLLFKLLPLGDVSDLSQMSRYLALSLPGLSITGERWRACKLPGSYRT